MAGLGVEETVVAAFLTALDVLEVSAALREELAGHLEAGGPDVRTVVEMAVRHSGDRSA